HRPWADTFGVTRIQERWPCPPNLAHSRGVTFERLSKRMVGVGENPAANGAMRLRRAGLSSLHDVDLDLLRLEVLRLGQRYRQHTISVRRFDLPGLHWDRQWQGPLELPRPALGPIAIVLSNRVVPWPLASERQHVARDR